MIRTRFALLAVAAGFVALPSQASAWAPAAGASIHPGVQTVTEGSGQCTSNFIYTQGAEVYIGQAAHCSGTGAATETDGCDSASLPLGTKVEIDGASQPGTMVYNSPEAVREHLRRIAERSATTVGEASSVARQTTLAETASERVGSIIAAAEQKAAEIESEALSEAERILQRASEEASNRISMAQQAVEGLVGQADELHRRVGSLGEQFVEQFRFLSKGKEEEMSADTAVAEITPPVPDPGPPVPPSIPEPTPDPVPEPTPDPTDPLPQPDPPVPPGEPDPIPEPTIEAGSESGADSAAARLVAMNLALGGSSREEIVAQLESEFGSVDGVGEIADDVLARVGS